MFDFCACVNWNKLAQPAQRLHRSCGGETTNDLFLHNLLDDYTGDVEETASDL
jgi:hypothetical protein